MSLNGRGATGVADLVTSLDTTTLAVTAVRCFFGMGHGVSAAFSEALLRLHEVSSTSVVPSSTEEDADPCFAAVVGFVIV